MPVCYWFGRGEGAASVLLVGMYLSLAALLLFVYGFLSRLYAAAVFSRYD